MFTSILEYFWRLLGYNGKNIQELQYNRVMTDLVECTQAIRKYYDNDEYKGRIMGAYCPRGYKSIYGSYLWAVELKCLAEGLNSE